tara:strand:- start:1722 stop:2048 length:327 start_codon:yes stop_codon:yes gene_type:complete
MISITDHAVEKLNVLLKDETSMTPRSLRVLVKTTGCSGLAYHLEYSYYANGEDHIQECDGFRVFVDPKSYAYVDGCEIDYRYEGLNEGFEFYNPKEKARCGCGESFTV